MRRKLSSWHMLPVALLVTGLLAPAAAAQLAAQPPDDTSSAALAADLNETVVQQPVTVKLLEGGTRTGNMIVTHFRPAGAGPFPVAIMNHGRAGSAAERAQPGRYRALRVVRYFVRRGFAVVVPTRLGYGATGTEPDTEFSGRDCAARIFGPMAEAAAHQIRTAIEYAVKQPWADPKRVVIMGQSVGGLATVVANAKAIPGVVGAINSAGGSGGNPRQSAGSPCSPDRIGRIYASAGQAAKTPMLWVYSANDKYWGASVPRTWHKSYTSGGGKAELVMLPANGEDGHKQLEHLSLWRPHTDRFLASLGFPIPKSEGAPPATSFAPLADASRIPWVNDEVRADGYPKFLALDIPRAFVIAPTGAWSYQSGEGALQKALANCAQRAKQPCRPYAVDDAVVWVP